MSWRPCGGAVVGVPLDRATARVLADVAVGVRLLDGARLDGHGVAAHLGGRGDRRPAHPDQPGLTGLVVGDEVDPGGLAVRGGREAGEADGVLGVLRQQRRDDVVEGDVLDGARDPEHRADVLGQLEVPPDQLPVGIRVLVRRVRRVGGDHERLQLLDRRRDLVGDARLGGGLGARQDRAGAPAGAHHDHGKGQGGEGGAPGAVEVGGSGESVHLVANCAPGTCRVSMCLLHKDTRPLLGPYPSRDAAASTSA
jgi:hypothetical protein